MTHHVMEATKVHVTNVADSLKLESADYGAFLTMPFLGTEDAQQLAPYDQFRRKMLLKCIGGSNSGISLSVENNQTSPGAGTTIASLSGANLDAIQLGGLWQVQWTVELSGTLAAADANNMQLTSPLGTQKAAGMFPAVAGVYIQQTVVINRGVGQGINVQAIGAATVGAVYSAQITATPLGFGGNESVLIGSRQQVQNGQGYTMFAGDSLLLENVQALYAKPAGGSPLTLVMVIERYAPYDRPDEQYQESSEVGS